MTFSTMIFTSTLTAAVIVAAAACRWRKKAAADRGTSRKASRAGVAHARPGAEPIAPRAAAAGAFAGVEIRVSASACDTARALAGRAFLAAEAPALPLEGCTARRCRCSFGKRPDRRQDSRRWTDEGIDPAIFSAAEKRRRKDRRRP